MFSDDRLRTMLSSVAEDATPTTEFLDDLWSVLERERRRPVPALRRFPLPLAAALAALLLALTVGLLLLIGAKPPAPPILGGLAGSVEVDGATNVLLAHEDTVIVGWPGVMARIDTEHTSLPGATGSFRAVAVGDAGWWVAAGQLQPWAPSGPSGWAPAPGPTIDVLAWQVAVGEAEVVALLVTGEYVVYDVKSGEQTGVVAADGAAELEARRSGLGGQMGLQNGVLWVLTHENDRSELRSFDAADGLARGRALDVGPGASMAVGADGAWVIDPADNRVIRVDPETGQLSFAIHLGFVPEAVTLDAAGYVWVVGTSGAGPSEIVLGWIDPATGSQRLQTVDLAADLTNPIDVREARKTLAVTDDAAWVGLVRTGLDPDPGDLYVAPDTSAIVRVSIDRSPR